MKRLQNVLFASVFLIGVVGCGGRDIPIDPIQKMVKDLDNEYAYTILLQDMDLKGEQYYHKYNTIKINKNHSVNVVKSGWKKVSDDVFALHEDNLGMEIRSKRPDGKINNLFSPPGFTNFIGNETYGYWELADSLSIRKHDSLSQEVVNGNLSMHSFDADTSALWRFHPKYQSLRKHLGIETLKIRRVEYEKFVNEYLFIRPFYGEHSHPDSTRYGTRSSYWIYTRPIFYTRRHLSRNFYKPRNSSSRSYRGGGGFGK